MKFINTDNLQKALAEFYAKADETFAKVSHGTHLVLGTGSGNAFRGDYGNTAYNHSQAAHAPSNAQKNSDITKAEIEAKLTGTITSHNHSGTYAPVSHGNHVPTTQTANNAVFLRNDNTWQTIVPANIGAVSVAQMGINKILFERYELGSATNTSAITEDVLYGRNLLDAILLDDFGTYNVDQYYYGRLSTHLYFSENTDWETTAYSDDGSSIYLNDKLILSIPSCASTAITLNFKKGWNKLVWILNEQSGNDSAYFGSSVKNVSNLVYMNAYPVMLPLNNKVYKSSIADKSTTADKLTTARTLTIGSTGKTFDGSGNVSWSLSEMGAFPAAGGTLTGVINLQTTATSTNVSHPTQLAHGLLGSYSTLKLLGNTDNNAGADNEYVHIAAGWGLSPATNKGICVYGTYATCFGGTIYTSANPQTTMNGLSFWTGTQAQYDALTSKSTTTIYMITE